MSDRKAASYLCTGDRKNTLIAFFLFLGIAVLAFFANLFEITKPVIAQAILLFALMTAAYIFIRYIGTAYLYEILHEEDGDVLLVTRVQGKRRFTQRKLPLSALSAVFEINTASGMPRPALPKCATVNYSAHLLADGYTLLYFEGEDAIIIRINADEAFVARLASYVPVGEEEGSPEEIEDSESASPEDLTDPEK